MEQAGISDFGGEDDERPAAEAAAVAGNGGAAPSAVVDADTAGFPEPDGHVEFAVMQVDYKVEGSGDDEAPVIHVFGRTPDGTLEHVRVIGFRPYFYAPDHEVDPDLPERRGEITEIETGFESIKGESLTRIYGRTPRDVGQIRDGFDHFEADILFPNRFLIDKGINAGVRVPARRTDDGTIEVPHEEVEAVEVEATPRVNTFDIEVDDRSGFPEEGEEPIICLASHDSYDDEYVVWVFESRDAEVDLPTDLADYDPISEGATFEVRGFETEEAMLDAFLAYVEDTDPDVLTGWNFDDFDAPYLLDRLDRLSGRHHDHDLSIERLSRIDEVWRSDWGGPDVKGRVVFDLLYAYQRTQFSELDSYRLDAVAETELGVGKERYAGSIGDLWEQEPERLLEYNLRDVELCVEIDDRQQVIAFWDEVRTFVGCKLEDATTPGDAVDMYVLHNAFGNFVLPSKGGVEAEEFEGGAVFDPITGVKENISVLDLKSLYPMSMATINASPETKVDPETYDGETYRTPTGIHFRKEPDGITREMIDELLAEREEKKALRDEHEPGSEPYERFDRQQAAVKVIMNSLYGVFGWDRFRLYDRAMSAGVTSTNREVIKFTENVANDLNYQVAYGDTDSVMLELGPDVSKEDAIDQSFDIEDHINAAYDEFARDELNAEEHRFQIEFEKLYRRFFQAGKKKRYAGYIVWKEGKDVSDIDITGFEYKRSDIAPITKEVQKQVIEMIVTGEDLDEVKQYVREVTEEFAAGEVDLEEIGIPGGIGKKLDNYDTDTAHVRGAKYANLLLGTNFQRGSKPKRLYLERVQPTYFEGFQADRPELFPNGDGMGSRKSLSREERAQRALFDEFRTDPDVICFEYTDQVPEAFEVDYEKMLEKTLKGPIARILEALDITWEEVRSGQQQTGLGSFT